MHHLVALRAETDQQRTCYFLTWGRIQDEVDPAELEALVLRIAQGHRTPGRVTRVELCSLAEAASAPAFFDYYFDFCQRPIPFGRGYRRWRRRVDAQMRAGHEIASVGPYE